MNTPRYKHYPKNASPATFGPAELVKELHEELERTQDGAMYVRVARFMEKFWKMSQPRLGASRWGNPRDERHAYVKQALRDSKFSERIKLRLWWMYQDVLHEEETRMITPQQAMGVIDRMFLDKP